MIRDYRNWSETNQIAGRRRSDTPNERWQSQQKTAWAKLVRLEAPQKEVQELAEQMITGREWPFQHGDSDQSPVEKAMADPVARLNATPVEGESND
jgi:hypothetical protein